MKKKPKRTERVQPSADENGKHVEQAPARKEKLIAAIEAESSFEKALAEVYGMEAEPHVLDGAEPRPQRMKLTAEESLKRMKEFSQRKEKIIAALRKSKNRGISS